MGLAAAYHALRAGHSVTVFEAGPEVGGMAAHFDLGGVSIERFYHFVCKTDVPTFALMKELGIGDLMRWRPTSMGYFIDGRLQPWGDPISLLRFPGLGLLSKLRYGALMFLSTKRERWDSLERMSAREWITRWCGHEVYERLWGPLFYLKFYEYADDISAAWIWARIKRLGRSRRSLFQEELGYVEGGSETLVRALEDAIKALGGSIQTSHAVERVVIEDGAVRAVRVKGSDQPADHVISTIPTPFVGAMIPDLPEDWRRRYNQIANIGVVCVVFKLRRSVTPHFWVNIVDRDVAVPGIIEFSNLRPMANTVVYVPYYMPPTQPKWTWTNDQFIAEAFAAIRRVNSTIGEADRITEYVGRLRYAQPVCPPGFAAMLPPVEPPVRGLQIADTCFYYPEDRGIAESVKLGRQMAESLPSALASETGSRDA
jgi:protoporphyrinogen oxidase